MLNSQAEELRGHLDDKGTVSLSASESGYLSNDGLTDNDRQLSNVSSVCSGWSTPSHLPDGSPLGRNSPEAGVGDETMTSSSSSHPHGRPGTSARDASAASPFPDGQQWAASTVASKATATSAAAASATAVAVAGHALGSDPRRLEEVIRTSSGIDIVLADSSSSSSAESSPTHAAQPAAGPAVGAATRSLGLEGTVALADVHASSLDGAAAASRGGASDVAGPGDDDSSVAGSVGSFVVSTAHHGDRCGGGWVIR